MAATIQQKGADANPLRGATVLRITGTTRASRCEYAATAEDYRAVPGSRKNRSWIKLTRPSITAATLLTIAAVLSLTCSSATATPPTQNPALAGSIVGIRQIAAAPLLQGRPAIEIEVRSERAFPVRDELAVLRIGAREFLLSRYPESGDTHVLIFTLSAEEFASTSAGDPVAVQYGRGEQVDRWYLGRLDKKLR